MGFVGSLEELGLDNLLQVVSLSSQSGFLNLRDGEAVAEIAFRQGKVVGAWLSLPDEQACNWLVRRGVVDQARLDQARNLTGSVETFEKITEILRERFGVDEDAICRAGRREVEKVITELLRWNQGTFNFETCGPDELINRLRPSGAILLHEGILPQFSLHHEPESPLESGESEVSPPVSDGGVEPDPVAQSAAALAERPWSLAESVYAGTGEVFLVDDDPLIRDRLSEQLAAQGWAVTPFARSGDLLAELDREVDRGNRPTLLIDLVMPRFNGEGILGGLELLQIVRSRYPVLPVLMFTDYFCSETEKRVQDLGVTRLLVKPHRRSLEAGAGCSLEDFVEGVAGILPSLSGFGAPARECRSEEEHPHQRPSDPVADRDQGDDSSRRQLALLKTLTSELCGHNLEEQARLLILRFAAELFDRAIIFSVHGDKLQGCGQFGFENLSGVQGSRLGELVVSLREPSIFSTVIQERAPVKRCLGSGDWERCFSGILEGPAAAEIFLGPVLCQGKVVAILYGDLLPGGKPGDETDGLEVFLIQVGLLKERSMLKAALGSPCG